MKCTICKHGETSHGKVTVTLQREETIIIIKQVPAEVCQDCGEYYLDEEVSAHILSQAEEAVKRHAEVEILRYAA